jgi:hypothetical protein
MNIYSMKVTLSEGTESKTVPDVDELLGDNEHEEEEDINTKRRMRDIILFFPLWKSTGTFWTSPDQTGRCLIHIHLPGLSSLVKPCPLMS